MSLKKKIIYPLASFFAATNIFLCGYGYVKDDKIEVQIKSTDSHKVHTWFKDKFYATGNKVELPEGERIWVCMDAGNLEAIVRSDEEIKLPKKGLIEIFYENETLFEKNNFITKEKTEDGYVTKFKTNYMTSEEFFSVNSSLGDINNISSEIRGRYVGKVSDRVQKFVDDLVGDEKNILSILKKFENFADKVEFERTTGKSIHKILKEYEKTGKIKGNCKEIKTIMKNFCNAKGIPVKVLVGFEDWFHTWPEICVPLESGGYRWLKFDAALGRKIELPDQYAFSKLPSVKDSPLEGYIWLYNKVKKYF